MMRSTNANKNSQF